MTGKVAKDEEAVKPYASNVTKNIRETTSSDGK